MKELTEILTFVTLEKRIENDKKLFRFMEGIRSNRFSNDDDAVKTIYGDTHPTVKYRVLKTRLKNRLINLILATNTDLLLRNSYERTLFNVNRNIFAAQLFILNDKRRIGISLLKPALQTALQYEHTQAAVTASQMLSYHEAYSGNEKEMHNYSLIFEQQHRLLSDEFKIEVLYNQIVSKITLKADYDPTTKNLIKNNFVKAKKKFTRSPSYIVVLYSYRIAVLYHHSRDEFQKVTEICRDFEKYMLSKPHLVQNVRLGEFALYEMESCMRLRRFEEGIQCAKRCLSYFPHYQTPWMQFNEYYFLLAMRTGNMQNALEILNEVTDSKKFYKLPQIQKERWKLHEAFLNFALPDELPKKQFRLFKFLNEVHLANRDKPGYNYTILLAQIILLINIDDADHLVDIEFAFREYLRRNIKENKYPRHYYFGQIIRLILKNNFTTNGIEDKATDCLQKMNLAKSTLEETEIIPYEMLWKMLCEKCNRKKHAGERILLRKPETRRIIEPEMTNDR